VCWISAYEGGLPLQAYAWMHQYAVVTSVWPYTRASSNLPARCRPNVALGRLAIHELNFDKRLFHTDGHHHQLISIQTRYGKPHPHRELHGRASLHA